LKQDFNQMTSEEIYEELVLRFPNLPNYEQHPKQFRYYVNLLKYYMTRGNN